jgi:hypothetical protein
MSAIVLFISSISSGSGDDAEPLSRAGPAEAPSCLVDWLGPVLDAEAGRGADWEPLLVEVLAEPLLLPPFDVALALALPMVKRMLQLRPQQLYMHEPWAGVCAKCPADSL